MELDVDDELRGRLRDRAAETGFESAEAYSVFVLETVVSEVEAADDEPVRERLEDLGYLE